MGIGPVEDGGASGPAPARIHSEERALSQQAKAVSTKLVKRAKSDLSFSGTMPARVATRSNIDPGRSSCRWSSRTHCRALRGVPQVRLRPRIREASFRVREIGALHAQAVNGEELPSLTSSQPSLALRASFHLRRSVATADKSARLARGVVFRTELFGSISNAASGVSSWRPSREHRESTPDEAVLSEHRRSSIAIIRCSWDQCETSLSDAY